MGSPITFSGFNSIDFNSVLNALMSQAAVPLNGLQARQNALKVQQTNFDTLQSRLSAIKTAATNLSKSESLSSATATSSDPTAISVSASGSALPGHYDVVVRDLARAQVTVTESTAPDTDASAVATSGALVIAGIEIRVSQPVTLRQLAEAINNSDAPVTATIVASGTSEYRLVLVASSTGAANAFTLTNSLAGGGAAAITFADSDSDGVTGNSAADNAVQATNADLSVNNISITSASNTLTEAIPGVTLNLTKKNPDVTLGVDVVGDSSAAKQQLTSFVSAYNAFASFFSTQSAAARSGDESSIGRNPMVRGLQTDMRNSLLQVQTTGGAYDNLSQIGLEFTRTGTLELKEATFNEAMRTRPDDVKALLAGSGASSAFARVAATLDGYTRSSGLLSNVKDQLSASITRLGAQIDAMTLRLTQQRATLQAEFVQAEAAMTRLKNQSGSLGSIGNGLTTAF